MIRNILILLLVLLGSKVASAVVPEQGLWWNPAESGRGYGIELQDNILFITYYAYTPAGASAYYTSSGRYSATTNRADLDFASFTSGQCFGCSYQRPTGASLGAVRAQFTSSMTGSLHLPGGLSILIQRQNFLGTEPRDSLYGTWHLTSGGLGVYFGDVLWLKAPNNSQQGGFQGNRVDTQRLLVGAPMANGDIAILVDSSASYYAFYVFSWRLNGWAGSSWTYLKTSQLSGNGLPFFASRILGKTHSAAAISSPSASKLRALSAEQESDHTSAAKLELQAKMVDEDPSMNLTEGVNIDLDEARDLASKLMLNLKMQSTQ